MQGDPESDPALRLRHCRSLRFHQLGLGSMVPNGQAKCANYASEMLIGCRMHMPVCVCVCKHALQDFREA